MADERTPGPSATVQSSIPLEILPDFSLTPRNDDDDDSDRRQPATEAAAVVSVVNNTTDAITSVELTRLVRFKIASAAFCFFNAGINDGSLGALIPYILWSYSRSTSWMALPYGLSFLGWFLVAILGGYARSTLGTGGVLLVGASLQFLAQTLRFWRPPDGLFAVTFFFVALGQALQDSQANTYVATLPKAHRWLGVIHGSYALGGLVGPLIAAAIALSGEGGDRGSVLTGSGAREGGGGSRWTMFYYVPLGIGAINILFCLYAFRDEMRFPTTTTTSTPQENLPQQQQHHRRSTLALAELRATLHQKPVWFLSVFFFLYLGAVITAGGWVVEYLIHTQKQPLSRSNGGNGNGVGYVSSAFYGGTAIGRLVLAEPTFRMGEKRMLLIYGILSLVFEIVFWRVRGIFAVEVVCIALMGFLLGPSFASGVSVAAKLLPAELQSCGLAMIFVVAQAGGAVFPALTGVVVAKTGVVSIQPILVGLLAAMCLAWFAVPDPRKRGRRMVV